MYEGRLPLELGASLWLEGWFSRLARFIYLVYPVLSLSLPSLPKKKRGKGRFLALDLDDERI